MPGVVMAAVLLAAVGASCDGSDDDGSGGARTDESQTTDAPEPAPTTAIDSPTDLDVPERAADAAETLVRAERGLRRDPLAPEQARRLGWEQQLAYRELSRHREWSEELLAALPPDVRPIVEANDGAVQALATLAPPQPALPDWQILTPPPPEVLIGFYREAEAASGIPWQYLAAIHFVESRTGRIRGPSVAGAQGPMQFIPETWARFGQGDIFDNRDAILAAGRYLDASGGPEDMDRALFAYNNDDSYVAAIQGYAGLIIADERAYRGYYHWQVYYATTEGTMLLPEGYPQRPAEPTGGGNLATIAAPR